MTIRSRLGQLEQAAAARQAAGPAEGWPGRARLIHCFLGRRSGRLGPRDYEPGMTEAERARVDEITRQAVEGLEAGAARLEDLPADVPAVARRLRDEGLAGGDTAGPQPGEGR